MDVRAWMAEDGITQKQLAKILRKSQQKISWSLKHGFQARDFAAIIRAAKGKVTADDLVPRAKRNGKRVA